MPLSSFISFYNVSWGSKSAQQKKNKMRIYALLVYVFSFSKDSNRMELLKDLFSDWESLWRFCTYMYV